MSQGGTLDPVFVKHLVAKLQLAVFSPGDCVTEEGDTGNQVCCRATVSCSSYATQHYTLLHTAARCYTPLHAATRGAI